MTSRAYKWGLDTHMQAHTQGHAQTVQQTHTNSLTHFLLPLFASDTQKFTFTPQKQSFLKGRVGGLEGEEGRHRAQLAS